MESEIKYNVEVDLKLTWKEALWLKGLVQNPLTAEETADNYEMRMKVWNSLKKVPNTLNFKN